MIDGKDVDHVCIDHPVIYPVMDNEYVIWCINEKDGCEEITEAIYGDDWL